MGAVPVRMDGLVPFLRDGQIAGILQQGADPQKRLGHQHLFNGLDAGGAVLVEGGAFFDAPSAAPQHPEGDADDGLQTGTNPGRGGIPEPFRAADGDEIRVEQLRPFDHGLCQCFSGFHSSFTPIMCL